MSAFNFNTHCERCEKRLRDFAADGLRGGYLCRECAMADEDEQPDPTEVEGVDYLNDWT